MSIYCHLLYCHRQDIFNIANNTTACERLEVFVFFAKKDYHSCQLSRVNEESLRFFLTIDCFCDQSNTMSTTWHLMSITLLFLWKEKDDEREKQQSVKMNFLSHWDSLRLPNLVGCLSFPNKINQSHPHPIPLATTNSARQHQPTNLPETTWSLGR